MATMILMCCCNLEQLSIKIITMRRHWYPVIPGSPRNGSRYTVSVSWIVMCSHNGSRFRETWRTPFCICYGLWTLTHSNKSSLAWMQNFFELLYCTVHSNLTPVFNCYSIVLISVERWVLPNDLGNYVVPMAAHTRFNAYFLPIGAFHLLYFSVLSPPNENRATRSVCMISASTMNRGAGGFPTAFAKIEEPWGKPERRT